MSETESKTLDLINDTIGRVTILEHLEGRIRAVEKSIADTARVMEYRLEGLNESRKALTDQSNTFFTRNEAGQLKANIEDLRKSIADLEISRAVLAGKASMSAVYLSIAIALVGWLFPLLQIALRK